MLLMNQVAAVEMIHRIFRLNLKRYKINLSSKYGFVLGIPGLVVAVLPWAEVACQQLFSKGCWLP